MRLTLASASPRRRQLLTDAGFAFDVDPSGIEEPEPTGPVDVRMYVAELAWRKAFEVGARHPDRLILAADTSCAVAGQILNKPIDRADAERMIRLQEGRNTEVVTGLVLYRPDRAEWVAALETSVVHFRNLTDAERNDHIDSRRWEGKAGAYGVQDQDRYIEVVSGSWSNVVGLPMERLAVLLEQHPSLTR